MISVCLEICVEFHTVLSVPYVAKAVYVVYWGAVVLLYCIVLFSFIRIDLFLLLPGFQRSFLKHIIYDCHIFVLLALQADIVCIFQVTKLFRQYTLTFCQEDLK